MEPKPILRIDITADQYGILYDLRQPEGKQIEMIAPLEDVYKRAAQILRFDPNNTATWTWR